MQAAILAATLILYRAGSGSPAEVLMVERARAMAFAPGALVFPGGKVDPGDMVLGAELFPEMTAEVSAAYVAAIRETIEEVGLAVGLSPAPEAAAVARLRVGLAEGKSFAALLDAEGLRVDPGALVPFARWRPDLPISRRFDTIFFLAEAPEEEATLAVDGTECVRAVWATPRAVLDDAEAGGATLVFPTKANLERLALHDTIMAARDHAAAFPVRTITPFVAMRDGREYLCIPDDCGYPVTSEAVAGAKG